MRPTAFTAFKPWITIISVFYLFAMIMSIPDPHTNIDISKKNYRKQ